MASGSENKIQCLILAGGLATRMRPLTESIPKALIPVRGVPFLDFQLRHLAATGVTDIVMAIGYKGSMIRDFAGDGARWGLQLAYMDEGENLRGTGGALRLALDEGKLAERFLVLYGDSFLPVSMAEVWKQFLGCAEPALMTIYRNENQWDQSNVLWEHGRLLYQKNPEPELSARMRHIDYGLMGFTRDLIGKELESGKKSDLALLLHKLSVENQVFAVEVSERFYEIGSPKGLDDFERYSRNL